MAEENKTGTENAGDADQQKTGNNTAVADGQLTGTPDAAGQDDKVAGLTTAADVERKKRQEAETKVQEAEAKAKLYQDQMALMQASPPQQPAQTAPLSTYEQAIKDLGVDPEFMTEAERTQVMRYAEQLGALKVQQQQTAFADQQFAYSHSDFGIAVGQLNPITQQFVPSAELQKILMEKPHLRALCNTAAGAYQVVVDERKFEELTQKAQIADQQKTQREVDAKTGPMSPAAAGGGAVDRSGGLITQTSTAADVLKLKEQVEAGEFD